MHGVLPYLITLLVLFISSFARSALGFADALIAMPLLVMALGISTAAPLVALVATTISFIILLNNWHIVDFKAAWRLILASLLGIPFGLGLLQGFSEPVMKTLLGGLIIVFGIYNLAKMNLVLRQDRFGLVYGFGFLAGVLGGAYNTVGPLLVMYGQLRQWSPERFRATLQGCFFPAYSVIVIGHGVTGLLTPQVFTLYGLSLPLVFLAIFLGGKLNAGLAPGQFTRYVNGALVLIGVALCLQSWQGGGR